MKTPLAIVAVLLSTLYGTAQVQVIVPRERFKLHDAVDVSITNKSTAAVTYCVDFGRYSFRGLNGVEDMESTPTPVYVQIKDRNKWSTLLLGSDIGFKPRSVVLEPGQTQHFPFRLNDRGRLRLVLDYWKGEREIDCEATPSTKRTAKSSEFFVD